MSYILKWIYSETIDPWVRFTQGRKVAFVEERQHATRFPAKAAALKAWEESGYAKASYVAVETI